MRSPTLARVRYGVAGLLAASLTLALTPPAGATPLATAAASSTATVYYSTSKNWAAYNIHYKAGSGTWTAVPGEALAPACSGWVSKTIDLAGADSLTAAFNNNAGVWDNNGQRDYVIPAGAQQVKDGAVTAGNPCTPDPEPTTPQPTSTAKPGVPASPSIAVSGTTVTFSWKAPSGTAPTAYEVVRAGGNGTINRTVSGTTLSVKDTGLVGDTVYWYKVRAIAGAQSSDFTAVSSVKTVSSNPDLPTVPAGTTVKANGRDVTYTWKASTVPSGSVNAYQVVRAGGGATVTRTYGGTQLSVADAGLAANTTYWYKVRARSTAGVWSDYSIVSTVKTAGGGTTNPVPTVPEASSIKATGQSITFAWKASTDDKGVTGYEVVRAGGGKTETFKLGTVLTVTHAGLTASTQYWYKVRAFDADGNYSAYSSVLTTKTAGGGTTNPVPTVPEASSIKATGQSITFAWKASTDDKGVTGYEVVRAGGGKTETFKLGTVLTVTHAGLTASTQYWYKVRAFDADGNYSAFSTVLTATTGGGSTVDTEKPSTPTNAKATVNKQSITVSWTASTDNVAVKHYRVVRSGGAAPVTRTITGTTVTDTGLQAETTYTYTIEAVDTSDNVSAGKATVSAKTAAGDPVTQGSMLGGDPREDPIYFMMTARWNDGDSSNNRGGNQHVKSGNAKNNDPMFRGDFKGVIEKLDYIKGLGFSAIWITPVVLNRSDYDFHGYHGWDFYRVDPRLESTGASYQDLINAAHAKGIKIYQDVVYNHSSKWGAKGLYVPTVFGIRDAQWSWYYSEKVPGKEYDPLEEDATGHTYNGDLWSTEEPAGNPCKNWGQPTSYYSPEGYRIYDCQWPDSQRNVEQLGIYPAKYYHNCFNKGWEDATAINCSIHGDLADFNTEDKDVQNYLINAYNKYIDMGVDGFRVDTAVHVHRLIWNRHFLPAIYERAVKTHGAKGKDFYVFGEVAQFVHDRWNRGSVYHSAPFYTWKERKEFSADDAVAVHESYTYENNTMGTANQPTSDNHALRGNDYHTPDHSKFSGMNIIDMRMHMNFGEASSAFHNGMDSDPYTNDATYNAVYVDSHDYGPNKSSTRYAGGTDAWAENFSLMYTFRGVPVVYYGSEIEFQKGAQIDCGPSCPLATTGRAYFGDHLQGSVTASDFGVVSSASGAVKTTLDQPLAKHLGRLAQIRNAVPALQKGQYSREGVSGDMAFKRRYTDGTTDSFVVVAVSGGATFSGIPNGTYTDVVTGDVKNVTGGSLTISGGGKGNLRAYVLSTSKTPAPGKVGEAGPYLK